MNPGVLGIGMSGTSVSCCKASGGDPAPREAPARMETDALPRSARRGGLGLGGAVGLGLGGLAGLGCEHVLAGLGAGLGDLAGVGHGGQRVADRAGAAAQLLA